MALVIDRNYLDPAGFRRVLIRDNVSQRTLDMKFPAGLTVQQMQALAQIKIDAEIARIQAENAERARLAAITANVVLYLNGKLNAAQQTALLVELAREWRT